jgi:hypothetical protein
VQHTALADIHESIAELRHYRDTFLRLEVWHVNSRLDRRARSSFWQRHRRLIAIVVQQAG